MIEVEQRSNEWFALRLGKVTASRVADLMAKTKTGYSATRENYMAQLMVEECGFVSHPTIEMAGASPDGLIGDDGLIEIKCPNTATMIDVLLTGVVASKYNTQMQFQMACTGRQWCDYVVFDPRMPAKAQMFIKRVARDEAFIAEMEAEVTKFLSEVAEKVAKIQSIIESK